MAVGASAEPFASPFRSPGPSPSACRTSVCLPDIAYSDGPPVHIVAPPLTCLVHAEYGVRIGVLGVVIGSRAAVCSHRRLGGLAQRHTACVAAISDTPAPSKLHVGAFTGKKARRISEAANGGMRPLRRRSAADRLQVESDHAGGVQLDVIGTERQGIS